MELLSQWLFQAGWGSHKDHLFCSVLHILSRQDEGLRGRSRTEFFFCHQNVKFPVMKSFVCWHEWWVMGFWDCRTDKTHLCSLESRVWSVSANSLCADVCTTSSSVTELWCWDIVEWQEKARSCTAKEVENYFDFLGQDENSDRCIVSSLPLPRICFRVIIFLPFLGPI